MLPFDLSHLVTSLIRTWAAIIVGALLAYAASRGFSATDTLKAPLTELLVAVFSGGYYLLVRLAESKWPAAGWLLGKPTPPVYPSLKPAEPKNDQSPPNSAEGGTGGAGDYRLDSGEAA